MIGSLLKQLVGGVMAYFASHAKRLIARGTMRRDLNPAAAAVPAIYRPVAAFDWLALSEPDGMAYGGGQSPGLLDLLPAEPRFILDIGCSIGDFAAKAKERFPRSRVWGVEPNAAAARIAAGRIDRVLPRQLQEVDWGREGVRRGEIDTVLLFDVLEHIYDPWKALLDIRNLIAAQGQLLVSIPNVRNIMLLQDLVSGHWRYRQAGLLDITHIRFFTEKDMLRMFYQTGFRVVSSGATFCEPAAALLEKHRYCCFPQIIELDSASITVHSEADLKSLCTLQHVFALQPVEYAALSPDERQWIDAPHPPTRAYAP